MYQLRKISFLSVFFVLLGVGFAAVVWMRLRSFNGTAAPTTAEAPTQIESVAQNDVTPRTAEGVIVPIADQHGRPATTTSQQARAREQRYEQLLRELPPEAVVAEGEVKSRITSTKPAQTPPPSLLQRVVKPIADALGMGKRQAPPTPSQMNPSPSHQASSQPQPSQPEPPKENKPVTDEDSDITPPRLVSLEFAPPVVQDGAQTIFAAVVTDDLSGVQSVSGVIASPSNAQQGFACQREGDTGRFIAQITIPKDAAAGVWSIRYLTLTDNARNTISLNPQQGTLPGNANFRVMSSDSDSTGPRLKALWLEQPTMSAGQKNQMIVQAEDDKSGVAMVSGVFLSPKRVARIGFACRNAGGDTWHCPISPPTCVDCGSWQLEQIQMQDKANNMSTVRGDNPDVANLKLQMLGDACDGTPPTITALSLTPPVVSNKEESVVRVTAIASDDQCGVASLSGQAIPQNGLSSRIPFAFRPTGDGQTFVGEIVVNKNLASGIWAIGWVQTLDKGHNMRTYSGNDPALAQVIFRVE